jgi:acyl-coenzyme A synthetase/AMP-(fatty) acid ligase
VSFYNFVSTHINSTNTDIAVINSELQSFSYAELNQAILAAETHLLNMQLKVNDLIILKTDKSFESLSYLLACIKLGIIYIPIDVDSPEDRTTKIMQSSKANALLNSDYKIEKLYDHKSEINSAACCVLYTSGSTGIPKGVICSSYGLEEFANWSISEFEVTKNDRLASFAPFHFDLSTFDLFVGLATGASIWLIDKKLGANIRLLGSKLKEVQATICYTTPTTYNLLNQFGKIPGDYQPRLALFAGEIFPIKQLNNLRKKWSSTTYYNLYGPTETNVCTYYRLPDNIEESKTNPYPIGKTCPFAQTTISDDGELIVSGQTVMLGYLNNSSETEKKLNIHNNLRTYKTGDRVRLDDNQLIYVGRRDRMLKRRGFRIELGEIENAYGQHSSIESTAAVVISANDEKLVALFYTGEKTPLVDLSTFGKLMLPDYMLPDRYIHIEKLPMSNHGKVDYKQLLTNFNTNE